MAEFVYRAITQEGREKRGNIKAEDAKAAVRQLRDRGFMPYQVKEANLFNKEIEVTFFRKVRPRDLSVFCRQFVSMISAGVTVMDALGMLASQTEHKGMAAAIRIVQADIGRGESLSEAMRRQEKVFPSIMVSMVAAGEASGRLETAFSRMADFFEKQHRMRGMIKKAAMYPMIVAIVAAIVVFVMLIKVVPGYVELFDEMDVSMPAITRIVIHMSNFMQSYWYLVAAFIVAFVIAVRIYLHTKQGEYLAGKIARTMPILGKLNIKKEASMFARTLSTLLYAGLPMVDAIEIVAATMENVLYRDALYEAKEQVMRGVPLSEPVQKSGLFPPMVSHMMRIGEETGEIEEMMNRLADYYDEEVELSTQTAMAALEPLIIIFMAVCVLILIAAMMAPMISMYSGLDNL